MGANSSRVVSQGDLALRIKYASIRLPITETEIDARKFKLGEKGKESEFGWFAVIFDDRPTYVITDTKKHLYDFFFRAFKASVHEFSNDSTAYSRTVERCLAESFASFDDWLFTKHINDKRESETYSVMWPLGARVTLALISSTHYAFAHVGDVDLMLVRNKEIVYRNQVHNLRNKEERARVQNCSNIKIADNNRAIVYEEGAIKTNMINTRAVGAFHFKRDLTKMRKDRAVISKPDVAFLERDKDDDFIVIANFDLWKVMKRNEVIEFIYDFKSGSEAFSVESCVNSLLNVCREKKKDCVFTMSLLWLKS